MGVGFFLEDSGGLGELSVLLVDVCWDSFLVEFVEGGLFVVLKDEVGTEHGEGDELLRGREGDLLEDGEEMGGEGEEGRCGGDEEVGELEDVEGTGAPELLEVRERTLFSDSREGFLH